MTNYVGPWIRESGCRAGVTSKERRGNTRAMQLWLRGQDGSEPRRGGAGMLSLSESAGELDLRPIGLAGHRPD